MTANPLRRVMISNFRRLKGRWEIPLDAPIVLIHGANGSGKTSVLAAIEFALTGEIRSMRRRDDRYTAHLPHHGSLFATIEIEISDEDGEVRLAPRITVGGDEIEGAPALDPKRAQFYSERAYLDQESLGQLLDLYQHTEGNQDSALARFVNELLGLDQLDALRFGLHDATDLRRLRRLSNSYADAEGKVERAGDLLDDTTGRLLTTEAELAELREQLQEALDVLEFNTIAPGSDINLDEVELFLANDDQSRALAETERLVTALIELRGRMRGLGSRPATERLNEARAAAAAATAAAEEWRTTYEAPVAALRSDIASLGIESGRGLAESLAAEAGALERRLMEHESTKKHMGVAAQNVIDLRGQLEAVDVEISRAEMRAGSLATGLAALREAISGDLCPVCGRDFSEMSVGSLLQHIDRKIDDFTNEGAELQAMAIRRTELTRLLRSAEQGVSDLDAMILADSELEAVTARHEVVAALYQRLDELSDVITRGAELSTAAGGAATALAEMEAEAKEQLAVASELTAHAATLGEPVPTLDEALEDLCERLNKVATRRAQDLNRRRHFLSSGAELVRRFRDATSRSQKLSATIAEIARSKRTWERRMDEANRRREIGLFAFEVGVRSVRVRG